MTADPGLRQRAARLGRGRLAAFALLTVVAALALVEGLFRIAGPPPVAEDPYVGFAGTHPVFEPVTDAAGRRMFETAPSKLGFFNRQRFTADKPDGLRRIFCVGGSTTYGRPYDHTTSFCGWLEALLAALYPEARWEAINAGGMSYASYRVARVLEELNGYQPDLYLVYTGHNEFLEWRTYGELRTTPAWLAATDSALGRFASYATLRRWVKGAGAGDRYSLPAEVDALLDRSVGPEDYRRDDHRRAQIIDHFRVNLRRIGALADRAGARVLFVVPAGNLRDLSPFKSQHRDGLTPAALARWQRLVAEADRRDAAGELVEALALRQEAAALDPRHAGLQFALGRTLLALDEEAAARRALQRAIDEDVAPLRAISAIQQAVRALAPARAVVDFPALIEAESPIPGSDWFLDHIHPGPEGHRRLALAIIERLVADGRLPPPPADRAARIAAVTERVMAAIDPRREGLALRNLARVLGWGGKLEEAHRLLLAAAERLGEEPDTLQMLGQSLVRQRRPADALGYFERALAVAPQRSLLYLLAADAARDAGDDRRAIALLRASLARWPDATEARLRLAAALARSGDRDAAGRERTIVEQRLRARIAENADRPELRAQLARLLEEADRWSEALTEYRRLVTLAPRHADYQARLGEAAARLGDTVLAEEALRRALALDPAQEAVYDRLGALLVGRGRLEEGLGIYGRLLVLRPGHVDAQLNRGIVLLRLGRTDAAQAALAAAVIAAPDDVDARYGLAVALTAAGRTADAIDAYRALLALAPDHAQAHTNLGGLLAGSGDPAAALGHFRAALRADPGFAGARRNLALLQRRHPELFSDAAATNGE